MNTRIQEKLIDINSDSINKFFSLVRANDLDAIKKHDLQFSYDILLEDYDNNDGFPLLEAVRKNHNPEMNEYIFHSCCNLLNCNIKKMVIGVLLDQCSDKFEAFLISQNAINDKITILNKDHRKYSTLLSLACAYSSMHSAKLLLKLKADIERINGYGYTPLYLASGFGHLNIIKLLIEKGANIEATATHYRCTPLLTAACYGKIEAVKYLHAAGAKINAFTDDNESPLYIAMHNGHDKVVKFLLENGADITIKFRNQLSPLRIGVIKRHVEAVKILLSYYKKNNLSVDEIDLNGLTPLYISVENNHLEMCLLLLEYGANAGGSALLIFESALSKAVEKGYLAVAEILLRYGAWVDHQSSRIVSPLKMAIANGQQLEMIDLLIKYKVNINLAAKCGETPLHFVCSRDDEYNKQIEIIHKLIKAGANPLLEDNNNNTPADLVKNTNEPLKKLMINLEKRARYLDRQINYNNKKITASYSSNTKEYMGDFSALNTDVFLHVLRFLDPLSLYCLTLINYKFLFITGQNQLWKDKLSSFDLNKSMQPGLNLKFSIHDGHAITSCFAFKSYYQFFSSATNERFNHLQPQERRCFTLIQANDLASIKIRNIQFSKKLLDVRDNKYQSLLDLIIKKNNPELNQYVFESYCASISVNDLNRDPGENNHAEIMKMGVILNQASETFEALLIGNDGINILVQGQTLLYLASFYNSIHSAKLLLKLKADTEKKNTYDDPTITPLYIAAERGHLNLVKLLLEHKADKDAICASYAGYKPIHAATKNGHIEIVKILYEHKASLESQCEAGRSPLHIAMEYGHLDIIRFLLEKGVNIQTIDKKGRTPLHYGVKNGSSFEAVQTLLQYYKKYQLSVDDQDIQGFTPLYASVVNNLPETCMLLLEHGASVEGEFFGKASALYAAVDKNFYQVVEVLCEFEPNFNWADSKGRTPLYLAAACANEKIVKILCEKSRDKINIDSTTTENATPFRIAVRKK